jgi:hypothetical protein
MSIALACRSCWRRSGDGCEPRTPSISPLNFLPELDGWRDHSPLVGSWGSLQVRHLDFRLQALAKLERGLDTDLADVRTMLERGLVSTAELHDGFVAMRTSLFRFPAVDVARFERRLGDVAGRRPRPDR